MISREYLRQFIGDNILKNLEDTIKEINEGKQLKRENANALDFFGVVTGKHGLGKSNLAKLLAFWVDLYFNNKKLFMKIPEWNRNKKRLKQGDAIIFDEILNFAFSRRSMTDEQIEFVREFSEIRCKGYFIMACIPNLQFLDKYFKGTRVDIVFDIDKFGHVSVYNVLNGKYDSNDVRNAKQEKLKKLARGEYPRIDRFSGDFESSVKFCDGYDTSEKIENKDMADFMKTYVRRKLTSKHEEDEKDKKGKEIAELEKKIKENYYTQYKFTKYSKLHPKTIKRLLSSKEYKKTDIGKNMGRKLKSFIIGKARNKKFNRIYIPITELDVIMRAKYGKILKDSNSI